MSIEGRPLVAPGLEASDVDDNVLDLAAMARMAAGGESGLAALYDRHATAIYPLALRIVRRVEDAEDVTQQVFTQAWRFSARYNRWP